jgi:nucleoid-associated protein YgaU
MTRETKIGLLVGLAFIITVGILLSNYMADKTELRSAPLEIAADTGHRAVVPPGESRAPTITRVIVPNDVTPPAPVPTREELTVRQPTSDIAIGGPTQNQQQQPTPGPVADGGQPVNNDLANAARQHGEELIPADQHPQPDRVLPLKPAAPKSYVVQAGDNLNKIATKTMGSSTKATRDAILKANPKLAANPNKLIAGESLTIPSAATPAPTAPSGPVAVLPLVPVKPTDKSTDKPAAKPLDTRVASTNVYIVKEGDNSLWSIAREQVGTPQAIPAIKELNKDVLKGGDIIRVGMRLKMPAKTIAMAN